MISLEAEGVVVVVEVVGGVVIVETAQKKKICFIHDIFLIYQMSED